MHEMTMDGDRFVKMLKGRAVVLTQLPPGHGRELAIRVNESSGRRDVSLRTRAEHLSLFELLLEDAGVTPLAGELALRDERGHPTAAGRAIEDYARAAQGKDEFFDVDMYLVHVTGPRIPRRIPDRPLTSAGNYRLELWRTDPQTPGTSPPSGEGVLFSTCEFSLRNCGNRARRAPKPSWRVDLQTPGGGVDYLNGWPVSSSRRCITILPRCARRWPGAFLSKPACRRRVTPMPSGLRCRLPGSFLGHRTRRQEVPEGSLREESPRQPLQGALRRHRMRDS